MSLKQRLTEDMKTAMKQKDQLALATIRMALNSIKNKEKDSGKELGEEEAETEVIKAVKQRRDAAEQFRNGGRPELADKEEAEIAVLNKYLPEQLTEEAIRGLVNEAVEKTGAGSMKDMGKVMGSLMAKVKGKADGGLVNRIVKERLSG